MILVDKSIRVKESYSVDGCGENVWVKLDKKKGGGMTIGCVYVTPGRNNGEYRAIFDGLAENVNGRGGEYVICGDFNVAWDVGGNEDVSKKTGGGAIVDFLAATGGMQCSKVVNHMGKALDLVFAIGEGGCEVTKSVWAAVKVEDYHPVLGVRVTCRGKGQNGGGKGKTNEKRAQSKGARDNEGPKGYNWRKANYEDIYRELGEVEWGKEFEGKSSMECVDKLYVILTSILDRNMEKAHRNTGGRRRMRNGPKWVSQECWNAIKMKNKRLKEFREHGSEEKAEGFRKSRRAVKVLLGQERKKWERERECELAKDPGKFYKDFSGKGGRSGEGGFMINGQAGIGGKEAAEAFADKFKGGWVIGSGEANGGEGGSGDNGEGGIRGRGGDGGGEAGGDMFSIEKVVLAINKVRNTKAIGKDGIPMFFVKGCRDVIAAPLAIIFNRAYREGVYPEIWKECVIVPTYKGKGERSNIDNYRPVAVANTFSKVFEQMLREALVSETGSKMGVSQHGYLGGRSTTSNLLEFGRCIYDAMEGGMQVDAVFTDLSCAFDLVCHDKLQCKLVEIGVSSGLEKIIGSFIKGRRCWVQVDGEMSDSYVKGIGVPQGSPLGGQLFIIYINEVEEVCRGMGVEIFADDVKIYGIIKCVQDQVRLQGVVNDFVDWIGANGLKINETKCNVVTFGWKKWVEDYNYVIKGVSIGRLTEVKDLGVILDDKFEFRKHRENVVARARRLAGFVLRNTRNFKSWENLVKIFCVLVRPIIEYAATVWYPNYGCEVKMLEDVQSSFLRSVYIRFFKSAVVRDGFDSIFYSSEGLRHFFKVESLEIRRNRAVICYFKKAIVGGEGV